MLRLRPEQLDTFQRQVDARLAAKILAHLRNRHAETVAHLDDEEVTRRTLGAIERARLYDIRTEAGQAAFVVVMFKSVPDFDENPLVRQYLTNESLSGDVRIRLVINRITDYQWARIADLSRLRAARPR